jgi:transposase
MSNRFKHKLEHTLEHKLESKLAEGAGEPENVHRLELITGTGRRRRWSNDDKVRIVLESLEPDANVSEVARRHGLSPQQLFAWRRAARSPEVAAALVAPAVDSKASHDLPAPPRPTAPAPAFAQVVVAGSSAPSVSALRKEKAPGAIEIVIGDASVRVIGEVATDAIAAVLRAVRRTS